VEQPVTGKNGSGMRSLLKRQVLGKSEATPGISTVMVEAFNIVQDRIARSRLAGDPPDIMISPRLPQFGLFDFHQADALIKGGMLAAQRELEDIAREIALRRPQRAVANSV
jgi:NTE family protein